MEELSLHLNKTLRDFIEEGHEKVGLLRTEDVAPAMKIVTDYRYSYPSFFKTSIDVMLRKIDDFLFSFPSTFQGAVHVSSIH